MVLETGYNSFVNFRYRWLVIDSLPISYSSLEFTCGLIKSPPRRWGFLMQMCFLDAVGINHLGTETYLVNGFQDERLLAWVPIEVLTVPASPGERSPYSQSPSRWMGREKLPAR